MCMSSKKKKNNKTASKIEIKELFNLYNSRKLIQAKLKAKKLVKKFPRAFLLHNLLGLILSERNEFKEAEDSFLKALKINPNFAVAYNNLANVYKNSGRKDMAIKYYKKSIEKNVNSPEPYNNLGNLFKSLNRLKDSIDFYKKALEINPKIFIIHNNLGIAYKILGELDKAKNCFNECIKINPKFYYAYRNLGLISKFDKKNMDLDKLSNNLNETKLHDDQKRELSFFLGKAYDDIKEYNLAYKYYLQGNNIVRKNIDYSIQRDQALFKKINLFFKKKLYDDNNLKINNKEITPIFIVGMPRSGTTLIEQILSSHSEVFGAGETEILDNIILKSSSKKMNNFFLNNKRILNKKYLNDCGNKYISDIKKLSDGSKYVTDKLPFNFKWIGFIKLILPNAKIIHCIRDPRDTCLSIFKNYFPYRAMGFAYSIKDIVSYYKSYRTLMKYWKENFNFEIYDIYYEDLIGSSHFEIKKLLNFINLNWEDNCMNFYKNDRPIFTASDTQVRRPIYKTSLNSWELYKKFLPENFVKLKY